MSRLTDHVLVLDRATPTEYREHHESVPRQRPPNPLEYAHRVTAAGLSIEDVPTLDPTHAVFEPVEEQVYTAPIDSTRADLDHSGDGRFQEVAYACDCGTRLTREPNLLTAEWARHVAQETSLSVELLAAHALVSLHGDHVRATCSCSRAFVAPDDDPTDPGAAIAAWAEHVEALA